MAPPKLRIAYVPEHFSTPLWFAVDKFGLHATLHPFPSGTGAMIQALRANEVDVVIGLTEGLIAGLGRPTASTSSTDSRSNEGDYRLIGTYVTTPLCWAVLVSPDSGDKGQKKINTINDLDHARVGVSRLGSGSEIMSYVLAKQQGWLSNSAANTATPEKPWSDTVVLNNFAGLIDGVKKGQADFFMWETFTSRGAISRGEVRKVDEIFTPWASWLIAARSELLQDEQGQDRLNDLCAKLDLGILYFGQNHDQAVEHICNVMDYTPADANEWLKTVEFQAMTKGVDLKLVADCVTILKDAAVLKEGEGLTAFEMVGVKRN